MSLEISQIGKVFSSAVGELLGQPAHPELVEGRSVLDSYQEISSTEKLAFAGAVAVGALALLATRNTATTRLAFAGSLALLAGCAPSPESRTPNSDPSFTPDDTNPDTQTPNPDDTGDTGTPVVADADGDGFTVEDGDCDDENQAVNPDAAEECNDGVDNNCDGSATTCLLTGAHDLKDADAKIAGTYIEQVAGYSVSDAGDLNADGFDDVVLGVTHDNDYTGGAYVFSGPISGSLDLSAATGVLTGEALGDEAGHAVKGVGDVSGDGTPDVLVVGRIARDYGVTYLVHGPVEGQSSLGDAALLLVGEDYADFADASLASFGTDLVIGAAGYENGYGAVYVTEGDQVGTVGLANARVRITGVGEFDEAGEAVATGDMDGDTLIDVIVGAPDNAGEDGTLYRNDPDNPGFEVPLGAGLVAGFSNPAAGDYVADEGDWLIRGTEAGQNFGSALAGDEDIDGDGYDDLLVGSQYKQRDGEDKVGSAYLFLGPLSGEVGLEEARATFLGEAERSNAGAAVELLGDMDGNGEGEYLIGASGDDSSGDFLGTTYLLYGPKEGTVELGTADAMWTGSVNSRAGSSVSKAGDTNGDGTPDLLIGAYGDNSYTGAAYVVLGGGF